MKDYLWVFILSAIALCSSGIFLGTIGKTSKLIRKLRLPKFHLIINFILLAISLIDIALIIYVFLLVKEQISSLT